MTVSTTSSIQTYNGDGVSVVFGIPFPFLDPTDLVLTLTTLSTGAVAVLGLGPDYSVGSSNVTLTVAPASGKQLTIRRAMPLTQLVDFIPNDPFSADVMERSLDRLTMALQQLNDGTIVGTVISPPSGSTTTLANIGAGHGVFAQMIGSSAQLKSLIAGTNITLTEDASSITIAGPASSGEANTMSNLGGGSQIFKAKVGVDLQLRSLVAGVNITLTQNANDITIAATSGVAGETNTASNLGAGLGLWKQKVGVDLQFKSLVQGANIVLTANANDVTIAGTGEANSAVNIGVAGTGIFTTKAGVNVQLKGLAGGNGITVTNNATDITHAVNQAFQFAFTGQPKFNNGADVADHPTSTFPKWAARFNQTLPASVGPASVQAALICNTMVPANSYDFAWNGMFYCENHSAITDPATGRWGESLPLYTKGYTYGPAPIWGFVTEAQNLGPNDPIMHGIEIDLCSPGLDPSNLKKGMAIYYGDAYPNTLVAGGANTRQYAGIIMASFEPRNKLGYGVVLSGKVDEGFAASNTGLTAMSAYGQFSTAAIFLSSMTNTPVSLDIAGGSKVKFRSGNAGNAAGPATWFFGAFVPTWFGALAILVDGTTCYIPVCSNHP